MKIISETIEIIDKIIGKQQFNDLKTYREINFCIKSQVENGWLFYNDLTKQVIFLTNEENNQLSKYSQNEIKKTLVENWFYVPLEHNDVKLCNQVRDIYGLLYKKNNKGYVILTTTDCNARCFYCYEHGCKKISMDEKTAIDVANYIIKNNSNEKVDIEWFGGEPLYNYRVIDIICNCLKNNGITYTSKMISNGFLFDQELIDKSKNLWNLKSVQITIDGTEKVYNKIKAYIYKNEKNPFKKIIHNIHSILDNGIGVDIRLNLTKDNYEEVIKTIDFIGEEFKNENNLDVYSNIIFENTTLTDKTRDTNDWETLYNCNLELEKYIYNKGLKYVNTKPKKIRLFHCMADNDNFKMILPNGKIGVCDRHISDNFVDDIYTQKIDNEKIKQWKEYHFSEEKCIKCPIYASCRRIEMCPNYKKGVCEDFYIEYRKKIIQYKICNEYINKIKDN